MQTSRFFTKRSYWLWALLIGGGLLLGTITYPLLDPNPPEAQTEVPALADPLFGSGGGPG